MIAEPRRTHARLLAALIMTFSGVARAQTAPPVADAVDWLTSDSASRTVSLRLEATRPAGSNAAVINLVRSGGVQVVVPLDWTVRWEWRSADSSATHSLVVMAEREKLPAEGGRPAFDNAMTRMVTAGLTAGQADQTTFTADQPGWYWMLCGVSGHAIGGEYIGLRVDPEAKAGTVKVKR
jgi:Sulfocyanin (SoxE) domain